MWDEGKYIKEQNNVKTKRAGHENLGRDGIFHLIDAQTRSGSSHPPTYPFRIHRRRESDGTRSTRARHAKFEISREAENEKIVRKCFDKYPSRTEIQQLLTIHCQFPSSLVEAIILK